MSGLRDYDILGLVGEGAFAAVYRVRRKCDGNEYALKRIKLNQMSQKQVNNSLNEVRLLASIKSPYIITYKEAFIDEGTKSLCIVTEFASEGDLSNRVKALKKSNQYMDQEQIWRIAIRLLCGLRHLHNLKVFHRDLKTANVLISQDGAKLGDLNVSIVSKNGMAYTQTGTPYYASPEVWNNKPYDSKCDIWSLGCVLYELAARKPAFHGSGGMQDLSKRVNRGVYESLPPRYSTDLAQLISLCLRTKPIQRPSCQALLKSSLIRKRIHLFSKQEFCRQSEIRQADQQNQRLLETIKIVKSINYRLLKDKLPKSNFDSKQNNSCLFDRSQSQSRAPLARIDNLPSLRRSESCAREAKRADSNDSQRRADNRSVLPANRRKENV